MLIRKRLCFIVTVLLFQYQGYSQNKDTICYSIVFSGNIKGYDKIVQHKDGSYEEWYQYNDRGRGDSIHTIYRQDAEGFPTFIAARGKDYMKNEVAEDFSVSEGKARWKNNAENEEHAAGNKLFYTGLKANGGNMIKALKANHNKIQLLPFGEVNLQVLQQHNIGKGAGIKKLWLCSITGLSMTPSYSWIDEDNETFASVSDWASTIRTGYEQNIAELLAVQKKVESSFYSKLALSLPEKSTGSILIRNTTLFDAATATLIPNTDVLIVNGVIKQVGTAIKNSMAPTRVIDGKGKTMLPGLWDMHVHFSDNLDGILHIAAGVTHVRDMGNDSSLLTRIKQVDKKELIGPKVEIMSGFIDGAGPFAAPTGTLINNVEEGKKYIQQYAAKGYQQIKLYSSIRPEWVKPLIDEAKKYHLRVCGHIPAYMTATQAVEAGYNEVTHMNMLALNFFGDTIDTRSTLRFSLPAQKTASLDLNSDAMKQFIKLLKTKDIAIDPTLSVFESMFTARDGILEDKYKTIVDRLPAQLQRTMRAGGGGVPVPEGMSDTYMKSFETFLKITKMLYDNGIRIVPGTDGMAGFDLHRELELYVQAGIPAAKVLQLATMGTATYTGKANESGSIKAGKKADMILVEGNPVDSISNIRKTVWVIKNGILYNPSVLYKAIAIKPYDTRIK
jgi:imidazolonepropionase-like amidohydrolase